MWNFLYAKIKFICLTQFTFFTVLLKTNSTSAIQPKPNLTERIIRHNQKSRGFTGSTNDWILVYQEEFNSQSEAIQRERQIKNWKSKIKIQELIQKNSN